MLSLPVAVLKYACFIFETCSFLLTLRLLLKKKDKKYEKTTSIFEYRICYLSKKLPSLPVAVLQNACFIFETCSFLLTLRLLLKKKDKNYVKTRSIFEYSKLKSKKLPSLPVAVLKNACFIFETCSFLLTLRLLLKKKDKNYGKTRSIFEYSTCCLSKDAFIICCLVASVV